MRTWLSLAFLVAAAGPVLAAPAARDSPSSSTSNPRPELPMEDSIKNPDWIRAPDGDQMARFYPPVPQFLSLAGEVRLQCAVARSGALVDCTVVEETPKGLRFGGAAIQMSSQFQMSPQMVNGEPVGGAKITIPLHFKPPAAEASESLVEPQGTSEPPERTLALARRLAEQMVGEEPTKNFEFSLQQFRNQLAVNGLTQEETLALDDYEQAFKAALPDRIEHHARFLARSMSAEALAQVLAFNDSAVGQSWRAASQQISQSEIRGAAATQTAIIADARARLCHQISCTSADKPAP